MGFKNDVSTALAELNDRVEALETLAEQVKRGASASVPAERNSTPARGAYEGITGSSARSVATPAASNTVDAGAIAFGLSEIKRKVGTHVPNADLAREYQGVVDYFADVLAKADPSFDRTAFNRAAGRS